MLLCSAHVWLNNMRVQEVNIQLKRAMTTIDILIATLPMLSGILFKKIGFILHKYVGTNYILGKNTCQSSHNDNGPLKLCKGY